MRSPRPVNVYGDGRLRRSPAAKPHQTRLQRVGFHQVLQVFKVALRLPLGHHHHERFGQLEESAWLDIDEVCRRADTDGPRRGLLGLERGRGPFGIVLDVTEDCEDVFDVPWRYLLASEADVETAKGSWPALKSLGDA